MLVPGRLDDPQHDRLELLDVIFSSREVHAEAIPRSAMAIAKMLLQSSPETRCEADVIQAVLLVEGIDPVLAADVLTDNVLVLGQCVA